MGNAGVACCWYSSPNTAKRIDVLNLKSKGFPKMVSGRQTSLHYKRLKNPAGLFNALYKKNNNITSLVISSGRYNSGNNLDCK